MSAFHQNTQSITGHKLDERAWIGWLVGFNASNIWTVWLPDRNRATRARDARIDETILYKDNHTLQEYTAQNLTDETITRKEQH